MADRDNRKTSNDVPIQKPGVSVECDTTASEERQMSFSFVTTKERRHRSCDIMKGGSHKRELSYLGIR